MRGKISRLALAALAVVAMGAGSSALAQKETVIQEPDRIVTPAETHITFDGATIDATPIKPTVTYGVSAKAGPFKCMVTVRKNFLDKAAESVSDL
jgi:hypothetical protein